MDGAAPSLPPISAPTAPMSPGGFSRPAPPMSPGVMPVGRPAADPEVQQQRIERSAERKRIESVAPKALDSRVVVYKSRDGKIPPGARPVLSIVVKDLEDAKLADGQTDTGELIAEQLAQKFPNGGKFIGRFVDRAGKVMPDSTWDIIIGDEPDPNEDDAQGDEVDDGQGLDLGFRQAPDFPSTQPPAPPTLDTTALTGALRAERQDEAKRGSELAAMMAQQQQTTTQMMMQLAQQQREAEERARRDAAEREERAEKRRSEFRTTLLAALPFLMPLVERLFGPKKDAGPTASDQLMLELVKAKFMEKPEKGFDMVMMTEMSKLMQSVVQGNLTQQQEQQKAHGAMQAEVLGVTMKTALSTMKEIAEMKPGGEKEESTFAQIAKIAGPLLASMQQQQQAQQTQQVAPPTSVELQQAQAATPQAEAADEPRRQRRGKVPPPPTLTEQPAAAAAAPAQQPRRPRNPADLPDTERIRVSLDGIRRLSTGEIEPGSRFNLLTWIQKMATAPLLAAIKAGDDNQILALATPTVLANPVLMDWVNLDHNAEFLKSALADLKAMLDGTMTRERMDNAIIDTDRFVKAHQPAPGQTAGPPQATVIPTEKTEEPQTAAPAAPAPPAAAPAEAPPTAQKTRRRRTEKQPAPAAPPVATKPTDPPAAAKSEG